MNFALQRNTCFNNTRTRDAISIKKGEEIYFELWTNTFSNLEKYML